ncbi:MAG: dienelactone hydrolase family protein [Erysipelotrichaceae bacterium]|nr:dienelactone hydrolase family protein [Erysipelotrichaceae bacterium]
MTERFRKLILVLLAVLMLMLSGCRNRKPEPQGNEDPQGSALIEEDDGHEETDDPQGTAVIEEDTENPEVFGEFQLLKLGNLQYYLYVPANAQKGMALIMYLHGSSNRSLDVQDLIANEGFTLYLSRGDYGDLRAFVLIPKLEKEQNWTDIASDLKDLITKTHSDYDINLNRVSLTGHSLGGTATYQLQILMPGIFACIAPLSGSVAASDHNLQALAQTRVWAFVGSADTVVDPAGSREIISALTQMGSFAHLTEYPEAGHRDIPALAYKTGNLLDWLISGGTVPVQE